MADTPFFDPGRVGKACTARHFDMPVGDLGEVIGAVGVSRQELADVC